MTEMEWAQFALRYLAEARASVSEDFRNLVNELREYGRNARTTKWYSPTKNIILTVGPYTEEFVEDLSIPSQKFGSPAAVLTGVLEYRAFVGQAHRELEEIGQSYARENKVDGFPWLVDMTLVRTQHLLAAVDYVLQQRPSDSRSMDREAEMDLLETLARRFHESALALRTHPRGAPPWEITNEWDCQYLFRAILSAYFRDVRVEEPNPSFAGQNSRCEFYLKPIRAMVELKYPRKDGHAKKIANELTIDIAQYGNNPDVDYVIALVYDPDFVLKNHAQLENDLSGETKNLKGVRVIISPPR